MVFPDPVISVAIVPKDKANGEKLGVALGKMVAEDPSFHSEVDQESSETILKGMGELHLDIKVDILKRTHGVEATVGEPRVAYRETLTRAVTDTYVHKKQTGGSGQYAKIEYTMEPGELGTGYVFESAIVGGNVPKEFIPSVEKGFRMMMEKGPLVGFPLVDVKVTLLDGGFHAVDSSQMAFEIASKAAYRQTSPKAGPELLETIMKVDVYVPDANVGDVIGDLNRRRGMIRSQEPTPTSVRIKADVPLSEMFGYIGDLRSNTAGRGQFSMEFSHYSSVPKNILEKVKEQVKEREAAMK
jgi:elongation factor G